MKPLLAGIYDQLKTDPTIIGYVGAQVYVASAPEHTDLPYVIITHAGGMSPDYNTANQIETTTIRVKAWSIDSEVVANLVDAVEKSVRTTTPALSVGTVMQIIRGSTSLDLDPDPTTKGEEVWMGVIDLECMVHRDPTV